MQDKAAGAGKQRMDSMSTCLSKDLFQKAVAEQVKWDK